ncbi:MAG: 6-phosphogluconate dehydrogenase, NAD-binding [Rhizobacter sp.]|nr:6-phosphogluconate dehydrogenase, NAD-binding [Rhizobacter sp.]
MTGFGDVGQANAAALKAQGLLPMVFHPRPKPQALPAAERLGLALETDAARAYGDCDLVLNVAPGSQALPVALTAAPLLRANAVFADLSSASPAALREAATHFAPQSYVDVAIMGAVSIHGHRTPLLASGEGGARLAEFLAPLGFPVEVLPHSHPGDATALKLVRSVLTKGMDAVVVECLLVAEALGLREPLLSHMGDLDQSTLSELMAMFVRTHAPHALRRLQEVETIEASIGDLGVPLIVMQAVKRRYARSIAMLGAAAALPTQPEGGSVYDRALPWMLEAERRTPFDDGAKPG